MKKVAIPILDEDLAPCFEVARYFMICDITARDEVTTSIEKCAGCEGFGRVRFLQDNKVNILICNGIKTFYRDLLIAGDIKVISNIGLSANEALNDFLLKKLKFDVVAVPESPTLSPIPRDDLVCWARELFESNGYKISRIGKLSHGLIDFVAEIDCPVCGKPIRAAICCGAHTYNYVQEIRQFHYTTASNYQARVYISIAGSELTQTCREYNVELIDPEMEEKLFHRLAAGKIPLLRLPIQGHERAFPSSKDIEKDNIR